MTKSYSSYSIKIMGNCCQRNEIKEKTVNMKKIKKLADSKSNKVLDRFSSPSELDTSQLTDVYKLPTEKFKTKYDVFKHYGYRRGQRIGDGHFGKVFKAQNLIENITVAMKVVEPQTEIDNTKHFVSIKSELFVMQKIRHPNILQVIEHFIIDDSLYIFMEYASGGNLLEVVQKNGTFNEKDSKGLFAMILSGVSKMHNQNIAHRDLKLANILVAENGRLLISDFGLSKVVFCTNEGVVQTNTFCGTPGYMSPELLGNITYNPFLSDIWALGIILYYLLNARYPFDPNKPLGWVLRHQIKRKWKFSHRAKHKETKELKNILDKMLEPDFEKRIVMKDLVKQKWIEKEFNKAESEAQKMEEIKSKVNNEIIKTTVS